MGDKKKGKVEKIIVDGTDTSEMKFPKLQEFAQSLLMKLNTTRRDRNLLEAQCAQLRTAWEMTKLKLQDSKYRIKATAMNRDKMEVEVCEKVIKEMSELQKFISFDLNERLNKMSVEDEVLCNDLESKWYHSALVPWLEEKTQLKLKVEQENENINKDKELFQQQIDNYIDTYIMNMDTKTDNLIQNQISRLNKYLYNIVLLSDTAFFRTQEEYNKIIREMIENGNKNTGMMREFYKRITEDDIIMILVLEKQVRKLEKIVKKKHIMCKKINEQASIIESSKGELELNLRRAKRKMKLYDTNTLALDRANYLCDKLIEEKYINEKNCKETINKENETAEKVKKMEDYITRFHEIFEIRQKEIFEPLERKIKVLDCLIKKDKLRIENIIPTLSPEMQEQVQKEWHSSDALTSKCMSYLIGNLSRLCSTHDNLVDFVEKSLKNLNISEKYKLAFKRIDFDITTYGTGPAGELITKYP